MKVWVAAKFEGDPEKAFDSLEKAEKYLDTQARDRYLDMFIYELEVE